MEERMDFEESPAGEFLFSEQDISLIDINRSGFTMRLSYPQLQVLKAGSRLPGEIFIAVIKLDGGYDELKGWCAEPEDYINLEKVVRNKDFIEKASGGFCVFDSKGVRAYLSISEPYGDHVGIKKTLAGKYLIHYSHSIDRGKVYEIDEAVTMYLISRIKSK